MKILIFDFEVFKYDVLLGVYDANNKSYYQIWDIESIKNFYYNNKDAIWVGYNNSHYDNYILQAIMFDQNPYEISKEIIEKDIKLKLNINLNYYDLINRHFGSLKILEGAVGKNISESEVDFNIDRPLTDEEKLKVESYNRDDLDQTFDDLKMVKSEFQLRLDLIKEFNLSISALHLTEAQIAEKVLKAKKDDSLINKPVLPTLYPQMKINNQEVIKFFLEQRFRYGEKPVVTLCGLEHQMGAGGMHAARKNCKYDFAFYFDVSGYYNLIMINYNLLSRSIPESGKKLYEFMYHEQIRLKKIDPVKRSVYKTILLAVFGAQMNEYSGFYDPWNGALVPVVGQLFLVDLLEKLEGKVELIQSNTDGIIAKPLEGITDGQLLDIVKEWQDRTGLVLKMDKIYDIVQRDVNNYMYRDDKGQIHTIGEAVKYYENWENPLLKNSFNSKEPIIIHYGIVDYFMNGITPEETVFKYAKNLRMFQYLCKPQSYDYLTFEKDGKIENLQKINRCFASKESGMVYKNKLNKHDKYASLPDSVFVWNDEILSNNNIEKLYLKINYNYYIKRIYERINEFEKNDIQLTLFNL